MRGGERKKKCNKENTNVEEKILEVLKKRFPLKFSSNSNDELNGKD